MQIIEEDIKQERNKERSQVNTSFYPYFDTAHVSSDVSGIRTSVCWCEALSATSSQHAAAMLSDDIKQCSPGGPTSKR